MTASRTETTHANLLQEMRSAIKDLRSSDILRLIKTLVYSVFSKDELATKSLTGKRSFYSGNKARLLLEKIKLRAIETVAMEKCPSLNYKEFI